MSKGPTYKGLGNDAISRALRQILKSPFTWRIDRANLPRQFTQPMFTMYNSRTNPVEHVSHFNQRMAIHLRNEALLCKVFPSSLGLVAMRWAKQEVRWGKGKMGRRATPCPLDISNYSSSVNRGNTIFNDLWIQSYDPFRIWVPNIKDELVHPRW